MSLAALRRFVQPLPIWIFVLSFSLDFKGNQGGTVLQYGMAAANALALLVLWTRNGFALPRLGAIAMLFWSWVGFIVVGTVAAAAFGVPFGHYIRTVYPYSLFAEGVLVAWMIVRRERGAQALIRAMVLGAAGSMVFVFGWGLTFSGRHLSDARYFITSPLLMFVWTAAAYHLFVLRRHRVMPGVLLAASTATMMLSVTRGFLLQFAVVALAVALASLIAMLRGPTSFPRFVLRTSTWVLGISGLVGIGAALVVPDVLMHWAQRIFGQGHSVTFFTRLAAVAGEWHKVSADPLSVAIGRGFGSSYAYDPTVIAPYVRYLSPQALDPKWFPGEFMWITFVFYAGIFCGTLVLVVLLFSLVEVVRRLAVLIASRRFATGGGVSASWVAALGLFGFIGASFTSNPFISRVSALYFGLSAGISLSMLGLSRVKKAARTRS